MWWIWSILPQNKQIITTEFKINGHKFNQVNEVLITIICRLNFSNLQKIALTNLEQTVAQSILFFYQRPFMKT